MSDFLFELGIEEVPVSEAPSIIEQLRTLLLEGLKENQVEFKYVETAATNRRFMVYINQLNEKASDTLEEIKGPAKRIAFDEQGAATLALKKFLDANQVSMKDVREADSKKGVYMVIEKRVEGRPAMDILKELLPSVISRLTFPKMMVWNESRIPFIRPIKGFLALLDGKVIDFEFAGIKSSSATFGHVLLSEGLLPVRSFKDYCELLAKNFVILREDERRKKIVDEITEIEDEYHVKMIPDNAMLEDYIYNNEYPVVFFGHFDAKYLELPPEIIATFMTREKKLLPVYDRKNKLTSMFIGVSNIPDENKYVVRGNEKVIRATFEDAKFFWDNDRKDNFVALRESLKNVMFHQGLGSYYEKTDRLFTLVSHLVKTPGIAVAADSVKKAALYCKNDLVTRMVREFPSLQGIMGGLYLKEAGADDTLWKAVYGHYEPKGYVKVKLEDLGAGLLSVADKMDNIAGFLSKGIKISSSKDPYGIRRDANGVIKVIIDFKLNLDLDPLIQLAARQFAPVAQECEALCKTIRELFTGRVESVFKDFIKYRYDVVNSILTVPRFDLYRLHQRCLSVSQIVQSPSIQHLTALHKRLKNIIRKSEARSIREDLLLEKEEIVLFDIFRETSVGIRASFDAGDYVEGCSQFLEMKPLIDNFFEKILVMAEDPNVRENRIALLGQLDALLSEIADFSLIVEAKQENG